MFGKHTREGKSRRWPTWSKARYTHHKPDQMCHSLNEPSLACNYTHKSLASLTTTGWTPRFYKMLGWLYFCTKPMLQHIPEDLGMKQRSFLSLLHCAGHSTHKVGKTHYRMCTMTTVWLIYLQIFKKMRFEVFVDKMVTWNRKCCNFVQLEWRGSES